MTSHQSVLLRVCSTTAVAVACLAPLVAAPTKLVDEKPVRITVVAPGVHLVDFGRVAFGNVRLHAPVGATNMVTVTFGEDMAGGRVNRDPGGTVRYNVAAVRLEMPPVDRRAARAGSGEPPPLGPGIVVAPRADVRNTWQPGKTSFRHAAMRMLASPPPPAILTPEEWDVVLPFRWVEIEGWPGELRPEHIVRQAAYASTWDDGAAAFVSSDDMLNRIWEMCRYSIKATTFAGVYVDGDRERIPYEGDAYLNQLSHYATDFDGRMARDTYDHLMAYGTWPTEWAFHMVFMAHADWWHTGDTDWLAARYDALRAKLLLERLGSDGLINSTDAQIAKGDLVDWPGGERDGHVFTGTNTVVNAFYLRALDLMVEMGEALGRRSEAEAYRAKRAAGFASFQRLLFDPARGRYRDGVGTEHSSLHSNLFPLAFGLVPEAQRSSVAAWVGSRGMDCSVYVAQYFMEALFTHGYAPRAIELMLAPGDRSWRHMIESGATMSWEAWDLKYKPNQDWNHAWGAAPANLLPRFILGVRPAAPGWREALIAPQTGGLTRAQGKVPTPRGAIDVAWQAGDVFRLSVNLPAGVRGRVRVPAADGSVGVRMGGRAVDARREGAWWVLSQPVTGSVTLEVH